MDAFIVFCTRKKLLLLLASVFTLMIGMYFGYKSCATIGLTFDVFGFLLLWIFGLPSDIKPYGRVVMSEWDVEINLEEEKQFLFARGVSHAAVVFILFGFVLQFVSSLKIC